MEPIALSKWYDKTWLVILLCFLFFPVGLYGLWMSKRIGKGWKVALTIIVGLFVLGVVTGDTKKDGKGEAPAPAAVEHVEAPSPELTQAQKDSVAQVKRARAVQERKDNTIDAASLIASYDENEVRADENFKGKRFFVDGTVEQISKDFTDEIYVVLEGDGFLSNVHCYVNDKQAAAELEKGQAITIKGTCDGLIMGSVMMKDCNVVPPLEAGAQ